MKVHFQFGYHGPHVDPETRADIDFDCESAGALRIVASSEDEALQWGIKVAHWYLSRLYSGQEDDYQWSENDYAVWTEVEDPDLDQDKRIIEIEVGQYPGFEALRRYLHD